MSKFNASVNTIGITEVKVRQALMKLLENSMYNKEHAIGNRNELEEQIRRLSQKLSTIEKIGWSHINIHLDNSTFVMAGLVSDTSAIYNLKVTFINTTTTARSCLVNGTTVPLDGGIGQTASHQTTVSGNGTFTIDNLVSSVDVFVRIWR